ncbi:MAG: patatin-like phospholipase family protein [Hyphomicrobiaceae bacterium]
MFGRHKTRLNLALQGGGAHGAFTWGVLDRLLEDEDLLPAWISGTSAGAINAVAVAHGFAVGGPATARATLRALWGAVERAGVPDLLRLNPFLLHFARAAPIPNVSGLLSPYEFNPLGFDPLRKVLADLIDVEAIRAHGAIELLIAATDVATGRARLFRRHDLSIDAVLASACLPTLHHAVTIDGRAYWDGGFSANPDLLTLAAESTTADTLLVQLNPISRHGLPKSPREIEDRVNTITFNQPLIAHIEGLIAAQSIDLGLLGRLGFAGKPGRLQRHRMHLIEADKHTVRLGSDSKVRPDGSMLAYLFNAGRGEAAVWYEKHRTDLGKRATVDLVERYRREAARPLHAMADGGMEQRVRAG